MQGRFWKLHLIAIRICKKKLNSKKPGELKIKNLFVHQNQLELYYQFKNLKSYVDNFNKKFFFNYK